MLAGKILLILFPLSFVPFDALPGRRQR